jgi:putative ABC transport system permease protein
VSRLRWRKLGRDLWLARARVASMVFVITLSVTVVAAFLSGRAILGREITANYLAGNPASATLHLPAGVDAADLRAATSVPGVTGAVARDTLLARVRVAGGSWQPLLLFVSDPADRQQISTVAVEQGTWPPPAQGLFLERTALPYLGVQVGQRVQVRTPGGPEVDLTVAGAVHDPGVAPAAQERTAYGQVTTATVARLGRPPGLTELKITVGDARGPSGDPVAVATTAQRVGATLAAAGRPVTGIDVPPPLRHPHYGQMVTVGFVLLTFGLVSLLLSAILVATMLGGMLTAQIRQIGAMKAVGARTGQLLSMYLALAGLLAATATGLALYPGLLLGRVFARTAGALLNLDITSGAVPAWVVATVLATGIGIPLLVAVPPLVRGTRRTVRESIDDHGGDPAGTVGRLGVRLGRLPGLGRTEVMAVRSLVRRPGRLVLTVGLLAVAGATFMTGLNAAGGWNALAEAGVKDRHYDLEVRLDGHAPARDLVAAARRVSGIRAAEAWGRAATAVSVPGRIDVAHVYPDDGHGSFTMIAPPADTPLITLPLQAGRWLRADDTDAVVLNTTVRAQQAPGITVGDRITLSVEGRPTTWRVVGIVSDFGTQGAAYVTDTEFATATGIPDGAGMLRVVTDATDVAGRQQALNRLVAALDADGIQVEQVLTVDDLRSALNGHVFVLIEALVAIALVIGLVGLLGLASAMSTSVTERTREFGIMHTLGATAGGIRGIVVTEGVLTGLAALLIATSAALPLTSVFGTFLGQTAFREPLPFTIAPAPVLLWTVVSLAGAATATAGAARRASRLTVREALAVL